jgi:hypothetical protein
LLFNCPEGFFVLAFFFFILFFKRTAPIPHHENGLSLKWARNLLFDFPEAFAGFPFFARWPPQFSLMKMGSRFAP